MVSVVKTIRCCVLLCCLGGLVGCSDENKGEGWVEDGPVFRPLQLTALEDGSRVPLEQFQGKTLIINFWATWCAPCREEMPALQTLSDQLDPQHYQVIGVTVDEQTEQAVQFLEQHGISFRQFQDPQMAATLGAFKVQAFPETMVLGPDGQLQRRILGARDWDDPKFYRTLFPVR